ncbi:MAG: magnesium transporter [Gemmatimonadales bacterium]
MVQDLVFTAEELADAWPILSTEERVEGFVLLGDAEAEDYFFQLSAGDQAELVLALPQAQRRRWIRLLAPDDAADLVQAAPEEERQPLLNLLDDASRTDVRALLAYAEDEAGGVMNPHFVRVRPDMTVEEALRYVRRQAAHRDRMVYYAYVLDPDQHLLGVVSFRQMFRAPGEAAVREIMHTPVISVAEETDQEAVAAIFSENDLLAVPVVDEYNRMKGVVTVDDIVEVLAEEATEDIQKIGGSEALDAPYLKVGLPAMIRKRAGWLSALFIGEMLTATAMGFYEKEISQAVILALFVPMIISSGGNSGSQATTLIIRAMALKEVRLRSWFRVFRRELLAGLGLGVILAVIGLLRILVWHAVGGAYGEHYLLIGMTVALSLIGVVTWGTLAGSMLPFLLRRLGFDPASASAPFVATLVDVTGLIIYFTVASLVLAGTLL